MKTPPAWVTGALMCLAGTVAGQEPPDTFDLEGAVVDAGSGRGVPDVLVEVVDEGRRGASDAGGRFVLPAVPSGRHRLRFVRLGYYDLEQVVTVGTGDRLRVDLLPKPIALEGLEVTADRLESRRRALASPSRVLSGPDLTLSGARNAKEALRDHLGAMPAPCPGSRAAFPDCLYVRGRPVRVRVWVDETPMGASLHVLETYRPDELERMEYYPSLRQVRVFSRGYLEWLARTGRRLEPLCIVC